VNPFSSHNLSLQADDSDAIYADANEPSQARRFPADPDGQRVSPAAGICGRHPSIGGHPSRASRPRRASGHLHSRSGGIPIAAIIQTRDLTREYPQRKALDGVTLDVAEGESVCLLGPNGSGKTTLFKILATLLAPTSGTATVCGHDVVRESPAVRAKLGVVFQAPSLDPKLRAGENLKYGGALYGLGGTELRTRIAAAAKSLGIEDRLGDAVEKLSGGLRRRVEIAKCLLSRPRVLLLDEPSTGIDPSARAEMWTALSRLREETGVTLLFTSHLLDEADRADAVAILSEGKLVAQGTASALRSEIPGQILTIESGSAGALLPKIRENFTSEATLQDGVIRMASTIGYELAAKIAQAYPSEVVSTTVGSPTLADVFFARTGSRFVTEDFSAE